tara:strand:+ start:288 stop:953 length:666 start_codon:yes stop_codon:yes gene_type:complete
MRLACLFSGGKDSCLALHLAKKKGHEIIYLLNIVPKNFDSFMFHKPFSNLIEKQASELGIKFLTRKTLGEKERELEDLEKLILDVKDDVDGVCVGGIASSYQGKRIKKICDKFDLEFVAPLWDFSPEKVWEELLQNKFEVVITKIACDGLSKDWLGRVINEENFKDLKVLAEKYKFRLDFEGGEAETAVLFMPGFKEKIKIKFNIKSEGDYRHWIEGVVVR